MTLINKGGRIRVLKYICSEGGRFMSTPLSIDDTNKLIIETTN